MRRHLLLPLAGAMITWLPSWVTERPKKLLPLAGAMITQPLIRWAMVLNPLLPLAGAMITGYDDAQAGLVVEVAAPRRGDDHIGGPWEVISDHTLLLPLAGAMITRRLARARPAGRVAAPRRGDDHASG